MAGRAGACRTCCGTDGCTKDKSACTGVDLNGDGTCETLEADWSATASIVPGESRENIYNLEPQWVETLRKEGYDHAQVWPVTVSGFLSLTIRFPPRSIRRAPIQSSKSYAS